MTSSDEQPAYSYNKPLRVPHLALIDALTYWRTQKWSEFHRDLKHGLASMQRIGTWRWEESETDGSGSDKEG